MVNDFLKKYQEEIISSKIQLKEDIDLLESKIKEENKFLSLLEESNESYFKEFTPRDINSKNIEKANEIKNLIINLDKELNDKRQIMKFYDGRLLELNSLLSQFNSSFKSDQASNTNSINNNFSGDCIDLENIKIQLNNLKDLIVLDPYRAKLELENIISSL